MRNKVIHIKLIFETENWSKRSQMTFNTGMVKPWAKGYQC